MTTVKSELELRESGGAEGPGVAAARETGDALRPVHAIETVSILIPTLNADEFLERLLNTLATQEDAPHWDLAIIDSSSTDRTHEVVRRHQLDFPVPLAFKRIHPLEFNHGETRNQLAAESTGELLVFLTQDAIPTNSRWLANLVRNFDDPRVGATYCRNCARTDAGPLAEFLSRDDPAYAPERREVSIPSASRYAAMNSHERRLLYDFNNVASAIRRELWERHPFPRTSFGEDVLMARALLEAGHQIVYDPNAPVEHSHDYDEVEAFARAREDGRFNSQWLNRVCIVSEKDAVVQCARVAERDAAAIYGAGLEGDEAKKLERRARGLRAATFRGLYEGGRWASSEGAIIEGATIEGAINESAMPRRATRVLEGSRLHILYVVHGFPPDSWAGTEVYTLNLAKEMQARGHRVTIFSRVGPTSDTSVDFEVEESQFNGLRVMRMTNRLAHGTVLDTYFEPRANRVFAELIARDKPDIVHFQHLIHTSAGLVEVAKQAGFPTIVHCHDYWPLCARVQMIRPNGVRCDGEMGLGCHACVSKTNLSTIDSLARASHMLGPVLDAAAVVVKTGVVGKRAAQLAAAHRDMRSRASYVKRAYASADLAIVPSRFLQGQLLKSGAFESEKLVYSPNGVRAHDVDAAPKLLNLGGRLRVGFIGSLMWYKGVDVLLAAMNRIKSPRVTLSIYGEFSPGTDEHHAHLQSLATSNVTFQGSFDNASLARIHSELDVLAVPSVWYENAPVTIDEAFVLGTPVVVSDIGGMAEKVRDGMGGLRFPVGDDRALANTLERFLREPGLSKELCSSAPTVKTMTDDAALMEVRYRSLCTFISEEMSTP